ncbi:response regulator receiver modulated diguanylate cyclase [Sulfurimonas gotlandica GD1]|uniref:diguanylate cyclase n=1 Tax=Sulfurimonas gotlandica (strain DSM 19862 / JCM 16533 / GD1) TaxID=929558 RepID=B6BJ09_SULGG|nr:diguanylate cyclase [Sulfurimonas gotlandica]EDZ63866.1 two-component response regulator [Sulfurimonas gotlandica GD1]EHP30524.1 response regulator receiver modulated diguanylate cyclase [Sulfurimonas gotlandica GD1]
MKKTIKILLIDDSKTILNALESEIFRCIAGKCVHNFEILKAETFTEASKIIRKEHKDIYVAVVDLNLPDCKSGQAVLLTSTHKIPTIVLSTVDNDDVKALLLKKDVLDYTKKDSMNSIEYVSNFVKKVLRNYETTALVVDDSKVSRNAFRTDLEKLRINVLEAEDGKEALAIMDNPDNNISLILTDYNMPNMDGVELTIKLRQKYDKDVLSIIALSASEELNILSDFIKEGANDFISKPHKFEELNVRVHSNLDTLELFKQTKDLANKDFLTGSYNRRYFFESSKAILNKNQRKDKEVAVATLDIDLFKNVNDTYGHDVGDVAIQEIAIILDKTLRTSDLVARFGGEEYCILLEDISLEDTKHLFEKIRSNFENNEIKVDDISLKYTVSLGIAYGKSIDINALLKVSDEALYEAKDTGRNKVIIHNI